MNINLSRSEREQIATILSRRANEIAMFRDNNRPDKVPASVDYGLELELTRLRRLADKVSPPDLNEDHDATGS